jgi:hypothetical protein
MKYKILNLFIFFIPFGNLSAQTYYKLGFARDQEIEVKKGNQLLLYPWAGGINSVYFSQIDLNLDGVSDFIAFEKHGNRILPFVNEGTSQNPQFVYAPEYKHRLPDLHDWAILKDFNSDGKVDIFTYGLGGIRVFQNVSNQQLDFKLVADPVMANFYGNDANIFASPDDYLGIADITGNGKLDILNFMVLGKYVHFYENISPNNQFFKYTLSDECWGKFSEAADNNEIALFTFCDTKIQNSKFKIQPPKHVGSSIFVLDFNDDGLMDVVIGDVDFPGLKLLLNGGTKEEALMISQTDDFPSAQNPVHLYSMPVVSTMQFGGAQKPDLFVSPSDPSLTKSEDINSVWRYRYDELIEDYVLETKAFLQEEMMDVGSGAVPVLFDWTGNGLLDLFVANYGSFDSANYENGILKSYYSSSIAYYKNVGTKNNPKFEHVTSDFGDLKKYGFLALYPTFADLTGDGKIDLLCGNSDGRLLFFENDATTGNLPNFKPPVNYQNIKVDLFSTPQLFDINKNGKLDLIVGNRRGIISYYQNTGTAQNPNFQLVTANLGHVDMQDLSIAYFGYSTPHFFRYRDETLLLCGDQQGNLFLFSNIDDHLDGEFILLEKITETIHNKAYRINEGKRVVGAIADLNGDNTPDLIVGNWAGGIAYFKGSEPQLVNIKENLLEDVLIYPNPTTGELRVTSYKLQVASVEVYDVFGRMQNAECRMQNTEWGVNISNLFSGIYIVKINTNTGEIIKKVVKQ